MPFVQQRRSGAGRIAAAGTLLIAALWFGTDDAAARGFGFGFNFGGGQSRWHQNSYAPRGTTRSVSPRTMYPRGTATSNRHNFSTRRWQPSNRGSEVATTHHHTPSVTRHWASTHRWQQSTPNRGSEVGTQVVTTRPSGTKTTPSSTNQSSTPMTSYSSNKVVTQPSSRLPSGSKSESTGNYGTKIVVVPPRGTQPPRYPTHPGGNPPVYGKPILPVVMGAPVLASVPPTAPPPPPVIGSTIPPSGGASPPASTPPPPSNVAANNNIFVPDEILVSFTGGTTPGAIATFTRDQRLSLIGRHPLPVINTVLYQFRITDGRDVPTVLAGLQGDGRLAATQPNYIYVLQEAAPTTAIDPAQYAAAKLHLTEAHNLANGTGVLVAVIDTAIDAAHAELRDSVVGQYDAVKTPMVPLAHGTAMAGAIVAHAQLAGVAPSARILSVRAFDTTNAGAQATTTRLLDSLQWTSTSGARVVNMSFAGPPDPGLQTMVTALHQKGIVLIAAAGNEGPRAPPAYPAAYAGVIAVTATDVDDRVLNVANRGSYVAVAAPGVDVMAAAPNGGYSFSTGTSIACAHVSGLAALLIQRNPRLTPDALAATLMQTAKDLGPRGRDDEYGAGLVDAYEAVLSQAPAMAQRSVVGSQP